MTRADHLEWAKQRAIEYADKGDDMGAFMSFQSDMNKHDELRDHLALEMFSMQFVGGMLSGPGAVKNFIEGFN